MNMIDNRYNVKIINIHDKFYKDNVFIRDIYIENKQNLFKYQMNVQLNKNEIKVYKSQINEIELSKKDFKNKSPKITYNLAPKDDIKKYLKDEFISECSETIYDTFLKDVCEKIKEQDLPLEHMHALANDEICIIYNDIDDTIIDIAINDDKFSYIEEKEVKKIIDIER